MGVKSWVGLIALLLVFDEVVIAVDEHESTELLHDGASLDTQIAHHGIKLLPATCTHRRAMVPPARRDMAEMLDSWMPTLAPVR
jgi:hypothetical protein